MATTQSHPHQKRNDRRAPGKLNLDSLALLFVCVVSVALALIAVALRGSTPLALLPAVVLGVVAILRLRS
jgi:hypothetical protein